MSGNIVDLSARLVQNRVKGDLDKMIACSKDIFFKTMNAFDFELGAHEALRTIVSTKYFSEVKDFDLLLMSVDITPSGKGIDHIIDLWNKERVMLYPEFAIQSHTEFVTLNIESTQETYHASDTPNDLLERLSGYTQRVPDLTCGASLCIAYGILSRLVEDPLMKFIGEEIDDEYTVRFLDDRSDRNITTFTFSMMPFILNKSAEDWFSENDKRDIS
jgi:hypothetical protein